MIENYSIRFSKRAKHLRLSVSALKGVEVVIPPSISPHKAQRLAKRLIKEKESWLLDTLKRLNIPAKPQNLDNLILPNHLNLKAINQSLSLAYEHQESAWINLEANEQSLQLIGNCNNKLAILQTIEDYLKQLARHHFAMDLKGYATQFNCEYTRLSIRGQRTRWGSCSAKKNISLNYKLLFIEPSLYHYVLLHELAHTQHLNHSASFWQLLAQWLGPEYRQLDKKLNDVADDIPDWINVLYKYRAMNK